MTASPLVDDPEVSRRPLTRQWYDLLVAEGDLAGQPVELLEGELVAVAPQGFQHAGTIDLLAWHLDRLLTSAHGEAYRVRQEKPFAASDLSEPEPDIAVIDAALARWGQPHPSQAHLIVEVADSSRRIDLVHKPRIYAAAGVPTYWVVDLRAASTVVHEGPITDPAGYDHVTTYSFADPLTVLGVVVRLSDILV